MWCVKGSLKANMVLESCQCYYGFSLKSSLSKMLAKYKYWRGKERISITLFGFLLVFRKEPRRNLDERIHSCWQSGHDRHEIVARWMVKVGILQSKPPIKSRWFRHVSVTN